MSQNPNRKPEKAAEEKTAMIPAWLKRAVPIAVSAFILWYYFKDQQWEVLWEAAEESVFWLALLGVVGPQLVFWFFETLIVERHLTWFHRPFPFRDFFWVRGAIYILVFANPVLGGGGILLYVQRKARISWNKLLGIMLFRVGLTLWGVCLVLIPATLALHYFGLDHAFPLNFYLWWALLLFGLLYMANSWMTWHHGKHFGLSKLVVRNRESEFWTAFRVATRRQWLLTWAMVLPPFFLMLLGYYALARAFHIHVPFVRFIILSPLFSLVMDMPLAFAGFGTATLGWELFFPGYGDPAAVRAMTLFLPLVRGLARALIALVSLKPALEDISRLAENNNFPSEQKADPITPE